jgi:hypothetical protein
MGNDRVLFSLPPHPVPALGPTQLSVQWVPGAFTPGVKWRGREAAYSRPSSAEVKNAWSYTSTRPIVFMAWCLCRYRYDFLSL